MKIKDTFDIRPRVIRRGKLIGTVKHAGEPIPAAPRGGDGTKPFTVRDFGRIFFFVSVVKK
ncbi:MAG TPA: hypothetical protein P5287_07690 [bacterium]|nr:hypothetical protein [bacterium]